MDRPARNKKSVDYSQFLDLEDDDEDFAPSPPVSKKARVETKKETRDKPIKITHKEQATPTDSQKKRLPLDDKLYQRDLEVALALSVNETSVIIENDENIPRNGAPEDAHRCIKDPNVSEVSFSNCSVDSSTIGLNEITDDNEELVRGRGRRQAASKAITEQRKHLTEESGDEGEADELHPDIADEDSESEASFSDEEFEVKQSKKKSTSKFAKQKPKSGQKEKNVRKAQKAEDTHRYSKDPDVSEVSFSNCRVDSSTIGLDEITGDNEELVRGRGRRQAASKAITEQRKHLTEESGDEGEADEFHPDIADGDSESDASFSGEDEEFVVKKSKKQSTSKVSKQKPKSGKKEKNVPKAQKSATEPNNPLTIKIKLMPPTKAPVSSPAASKPALHSSPPVGMKRPAWAPPASSGAVKSPLAGEAVRSPNPGLRLGLSRLARVKPLHPTTALH